MGLIIDKDSAEDILFELNKPLSNSWSKQFASNSLKQQSAQGAIDESYSNSLMNTYQTYLQSKNQIGTSGLIDGLRDAADQYNYESLQKAYDASMSDRLSNSYDLYQSYLQAQGVVGDEIVELGEAYSKRADSYLEYMKQANLDENIMDYLRKVGLRVTNEDSGEERWADDSVFRNIMFATEPMYNEAGDLIANAGELTPQGKAIFNMIQSNTPKGDQSVVEDLSYDAWVSQNKDYMDDRVDSSIMRGMLGIEGETGKRYSKRELMELSPEYAQAIADQETNKLGEYDLHKNATFNTLESNQDMRMSMKNYDDMVKLYDDTISTIKSSLEEYGYTEEEFNNFLKEQGYDFTLSDAGRTEIDDIINYVVTDEEKRYESNLSSNLTTSEVMKGVGEVAMVGGFILAFFTFGAGALISVAGAADYMIAEDDRKRTQKEYDDLKYKLDVKSRGARDATKALGIYYDDIKRKYEEFMSSRSKYNGKSKN